jgi:hypothetical protein
LVDLGSGAHEGVPFSWAAPGVLGAAKAPAGDFRMGLLGLRQDVTFAISDSAMVQNDTGEVVFKAWQQDMQIARVVFRVAFPVATRVTEREAAGDRQPLPVCRADMTLGWHGGC